MAQDPERFLDAAVKDGHLTAEQAQECRRIAAVLAEVDIPLGADEIALRKGYLARDDVDALKRVLARRRVGKYEILERLGEGEEDAALRT